MGGRGQGGRGKGAKMSLKSFWLDITVMSELNLKIVLISVDSEFVLEKEITKEYKENNKIVTKLMPSIMSN